ncbi:MAG: DUF4347 domain-containing protein [Symploca sp. SIO1C4]|uniref:DUF4347 domain-containing protein n=1 Tax=Symploca sp. SIO1C4 TaxID=2607765 RepID=A0A6B3ND13_9CYAN|nr:DUF4347 domain-containing protein [Symploca sp. SIO1C4]
MLGYLKFYLPVIETIMKTIEDYHFNKNIILKKLLIQNNQSQQQQQVISNMLVVIDQKVEDYKVLAAGVKSGAQVLILDSHRDGVEQITAALQGYTEISSIHIVSHGSPGCLDLGNTQLSLCTLNQYASQLRSWFSPAILLYGCNVACGDAGAEFIERLHQLTGAKIAASATPTGNKALGGNWELEVTTGEIAVSLAFTTALRESYAGVLSSVDFDSSFGNNGIVTTNIANRSDTYIGASSTVIQPDGKVVVAGSTGGFDPIDSDFALVRYNSDGSLDSSFDSNGIVTTDIAGDDEGVNSTNIALQQDGKIVLAGTTLVARDEDFPWRTDGDFALVRYNSDGSLDSSFGENGIVTTDIAGKLQSGNDVVLQPDGKIIVVGSSANDSGEDFALVRYNSDGSLDNSFGENGISLTNIANTSNRFGSSILQADGKIVVVGTAKTDSGRDFAVVRYNSDGSLDNSFGTDGIVTTNLAAINPGISNTISSSSSWAGNVALQLDGKIVVVGTTSTLLLDPDGEPLFDPSLSGLALVRYNSDGSVDSGFGDNGIVITNTAHDGYSIETNVALQSDGKIVLAAGGVTYDFNNQIYQSILIRYDSDGNLDSSFGINSILFSEDVKGGGAPRLAIDPEGKIVAAGGENNDLLVAVYNINEPIVTLTTTDNTAVERTPANDTGIYRVSRNTIDGDLTIQLTIDSNSTTELSDYILAGGEVNLTDSNLAVTIPDGEEFLEITLTPIDDTLPENTETLQLNLAPDPAYEIDADNNSASITITANDEISYAVTLNSTTPIVEGDTASQTVSFTVTRSGGIGIASSVDYAITNSAPLGNNDFNNVQIDSVASGVSGTISFAPGEETKTITLEVLDDQIAETSENLIITLSNPNLTEAPVNSSITTPTALVAITDDDSNTPVTLNKTLEDTLFLTGSSSQTQLQFTLTERNTSFVNEVGVFIVDNEQGRIDSIAPGTPGYLEAALERGQVIFSSLADNVFPQLSSTRQLSFDTDTRLGFYLVQDDTTDNVLADLAAGRTSTNVFLNFSDANPDNFDYLEVSPLEENHFQLNWKDSLAGAEADFNDLVLTVDINDNPPPLGTQLQGGQQAELIDLRDQITGIVAAEFVINSDAAFDNSFGFYVVDNPNGQIGTLNPGDSGYAQAAVSNRVDLESGLPGDALLAPFLIADGTAEEFLAVNPNNSSGQGPLAYFAYLDANSDGFDHVRLLGDNLFGFEDFEGGGDADYNDLVVEVSFF